MTQLQDSLEKSADVGMPSEMTDFASQRLMELIGGTLTNYGW